MSRGQCSWTRLGMLSAIYGPFSNESWLKLANILSLAFSHSLKPVQWCVIQTKAVPGPHSRDRQHANYSLKCLQFEIEAHIANGLVCVTNSMMPEWRLNGGELVAYWNCVSLSFWIASNGVWDRHHHIISWCLAIGISTILMESIVWIGFICSPQV